MATAKEDKLLESAIADTESELFSDAFKKDAPDGEDDRSLEESKDDLDEVEEEDEQPDKAKVEAEGDGKEKAAAKDGKADDKTEEVEPEPEVVEDRSGRVPSGLLRTANERARKAEAELATFRADLKTKGETDQQGVKALADKLDLALREIADLKRPQRVEPKPEAKTETIPDPLEDPKGYTAYNDRRTEARLSELQTRFATERFNDSLEAARERDSKTFDTAWTALNALDRTSPADQATVQSIVSARNPGSALLRWHRDQETLREVGDDPAKFKERIATETRETLMKDPEFRKQLLAGLREEAEVGEDGKPRTLTRLPRSLNSAPGGNGSRRGDPDDEAGDDSDSGLFEAAFAHRARA